MEDQSMDGQILNFTCDHCDISLTVDGALAGISGPCPACGKTTTAPAPTIPKPIARKPRMIPGKEVAKSDHGVNLDDRGRGVRPRRIDPGIGISDVTRERSEVATVAKMLVAGLVVLVIILGVTYLLKQ